jgi:MoaA/NifB/PqqE/SkfB family radical SAM enzyme
MPDIICTDTQETANARALDFLWLELTNQCNLQCLHCYSESAPHTTEKNLLDETHYETIISDARMLGCHRIQFIGGEPTLNKSLPKLIVYADDCGYEFIEVFSNLVNLSFALLETFVRHRVAVATSVYACDPALHDLVTQTPGSHARTIQNIKRVLDSGLSLRVAVISMDENEGAIDSTFALLRDLGVTNIGLDHVRGFGRAQSQNTCSMEDLCGNCAGSVLAIGPDGVVAPCIMSKNWPVGSVLNSSLREVVFSDHLLQTRERIASATAVNTNVDPCGPACSPYNPFCNPNCSPHAMCGPCSPSGSKGCNPNYWCNPNQK